MDARAAASVCVLYRWDGKTMRHTGLSLGDGRAVDARGHREGVVMADIGSYPWTHYALLPPPAARQAPPPPTPEERLNDVERRVAALEERMKTP